jgi:hypothetical protein
MVRRAFNPNKEASIADALPHAERKFACFAGGCPMPGTIFRDGSDKAGCCAWHYAALPSDIPRITQVLKDWACISDEVQAARRALTGQFATDPKALRQLFTEASHRVRDAVAGGGWGNQFDPKLHEDYGTWAGRLQDFLTSRVSEATSTRRAA